MLARLKSCGSGCFGATAPPATPLAIEVQARQAGVEAVKDGGAIDAFDALDDSWEGDDAVDAVATRWLHPGDHRLPPLVEVPTSLTIGEKRLRAVVKPPDPDSLWDWYNERGDTEADPSWAHVWPSSAALAGLLATQPSLVRGLRVADFGAGLGIAGLAAALAGAADVILLDREPLALHCAMATASVNGLPTAAVADTGVPVGTVRASVFDWSMASSFNGAVDVVLASEVLYDPSTVRQLAESMVGLLRSQSAGAVRSARRVLLTDPERERVAGCREAFVKALKERGATVAERTIWASNLGEGLGAKDLVVLLDATWP